MEKSTVNEVRVYSETTDAFGGYNEGVRIDENEFRNIVNMSSDGYPALVPRKGRGVYAITRTSGASNELIYYPVTGREYEYRLAVVEDIEDSSHAQKIVIENYSYSTSSSAVHYIAGYDHNIFGVIATLHDYAMLVKDYTFSYDLWTAKRTSTVQMGLYTILHNNYNGDMVYFNSYGRCEIENLQLWYTDSGKVGGSTTITGWEMSVCKEDGTEYADTISVSATPPSYPTYSYWLNTSTSPSSLYRYDTASSTWVEDTAVYLKLEATDIEDTCDTGDTPTITFSNSRATILGLHSVGAVVTKGTDYIVFSGWMNYKSYQTTTETVTVAKTVPIMDFIVVSGNRLWGCRYGSNRDGEFVNEIYASKLGDFQSWTVYEGISTDSYTASVGSEGAFTGAIEYLGHPIFFKENYIHRIYGTEPSNFQVQTLPCEGVMEGAGKTLCLCDNLLYYMSRDNICAYDGSRPYHMGDAVAESVRSVREMTDKTYLVLNAGVWKGKYYLYMNTNGTQYYESAKGVFLVYDTTKGLWHKETDEEGYTAEIMASLSDGLFCSKGTINSYPDTADGWWISPSSTVVEITGNYVWSVEGIYNATMTSSGALRYHYGHGNAKCEHKMEWSAETGEVGLSDPKHRVLQRAVAKVKVGAGCLLRMWVEYDSNGEWKLIRTIDGVGNTGNTTVVLRPRRCDHFRIKFDGIGEDVAIYSLTKYYENGEE